MDRKNVLAVSFVMLIVGALALTAILLIPSVSNMWLLLPEAVIIMSLFGIVFAKKTRSDDDENEREGNLSWALVIAIALAILCAVATVLLAIYAGWFALLGAIGLFASLFWIFCLLGRIALKWASVLALVIAIILFGVYAILGTMDKDAKHIKDLFVDNLIVKDGEVNINDSDVNVKDSKINLEKDEIAVKDSNYSIKDSKIVVKDSNIESQNNVIDAHNNDIDVHDNNIVFSDNNVEAKNNTIDAHDNTIISKNNVVKEEPQSSKPSTSKPSETTPVADGKGGDTQPQSTKPQETAPVAISIKANKTSFNGYSDVVIIETTGVKASDLGISNSRFCQLNILSENKAELVIKDSYVDADGNVQQTEMDEPHGNCVVWVKSDHSYNVRVTF